MENLTLRVEVTNPETDEKLYVMVRHQDLVTKTEEELVQIISTIINEKMKTND